MVILAMPAFVFNQLSTTFNSVIFSQHLNGLSLTEPVLLLARRADSTVFETVHPDLRLRNHHPLIFQNTK